MLQSLDIRNLTVFVEAHLRFSPQLNVIVGENGSGKSHLLKVAYAVLAASAEEGRKSTVSAPTKTLLQTRLAEKLVTVLRPESLGRLARRKQGRERCALRFGFDNRELNIACSFATSSKSEVNIDRVPTAWVSRTRIWLACHRGHRVAIESAGNSSPPSNTVDIIANKFLGLPAVNSKVV